MFAPVTRNAYFLLLLPLLTSLVDSKLPNLISDFGGLQLPRGVLVFMVTDMLVRVPGIGGWLRDLGIPLLTVMWLMIAGASMLLAEPAVQVGDYSQMQVEQ